MAEGMDEAAKRMSCGGISYDVIIKPASGENPLLPMSPSKEKPSISQEDIDRKLREAEERRKQLEAQKLQSLKETDRIQEVNEKINTFSKEVEKKLLEKMDASEESKRAQEAAKLEKLKEHDRHVEEVRRKKLEQEQKNQCEG